MQVEPMKSKLKAPGIKRLKLKYDEPLSKFAFKSNLRRYTEARANTAEARTAVLEELTVDSEARLTATKVVRCWLNPSAVNASISA